MKHKYCPSCGSLDFKRLATGMEECTRCHFRGEFKEGSMDEINAFRKAHKPTGSAASSGSMREIPAGQKGSDILKERLAALKGKKTDDFEII